MTTFNITISEDLTQLLTEKSQELSISASLLVEKALVQYFDQLNKDSYINAFKQMPADPDILSISEEGMNDYLNQVEG